MSSLLSFDLVLLYYDNPEILRNWFHRLVYHSDFQQFAQLCNANLIIADSGSPKDRLEDNYKVVQEQPEWIRKRTIYARAETTEIRKACPPGVLVRPQSHAYNMACMDISKADVIIGSVIGHIFTPKYFNGHVAEHIKDNKVIVLPKRFDLESNDYHEKGIDLPWEVLFYKFKFIPSGGWPDYSVRREHFVAIGGWDEYYTFVAPADMEFGARLCGKLDNGLPAEWLFPQQRSYKNYGLNFSQPYRNDFLSLTCNTYRSHKSKNDAERQHGHKIGNEYYLTHWGEIYRNENRIPIEYDTRLFQ